MELAGARILVTGGAGFLGKYLVEKFSERGAIVMAPRSADHDLVDREQVKSLFADTNPSIVVHAAGFLGGINFSRLYPAKVFLRNLQMACNILEMADSFGVSKLVNIGSACVYSDQLQGPFKEEDVLSLPMHESVRNYGFSKLALYLGGLAFQEQSALNAIHLIPANLYGPRDKFDPELSHVVSSMIPKFYEAKVAGAPSVQCWGTGSTIREFVYVEDCADAVVLATEKYDKPAPLNIGVGHGISIKDLAETIKMAVGYSGEIDWDISKPDGAGYKVLDITRIQNELGWKPETPFETGMQKTVEWFVAYHDGK